MMFGFLMHSKLHDLGDARVHKGDIYNALIGANNALTAGNVVADAQWVTDQIAAATGDLRGKDPVDAATTAALPANTRVGDVLTADFNGVFPPVDGVTMNLDDTLLVKNEGGGASHINNGIYVVTDQGSLGDPWILTRRSDLVGDENASHIFLDVDDGTVNVDSSFKCINNEGSAVVNTDALEFKFWGQTTDHANLKNLPYELSGHSMLLHPLCYNISNNYGTAAARDGSAGMPFQSVQEAIDKAVSLGKSRVTAILDPQDSIYLQSMTMPDNFQLSIVSLFSAAYWAFPTLTGALAMGNACKLMIDGVEVTNLLSAGTSTYIYVKSGIIKAPAGTFPNTNVVLWPGSFAEDNYAALDAKFATVSGMVHEQGDIFRFPGSTTDPFPAIHAMGRVIAGVKDGPTAGDFATNKNYVDGAIDADIATHTADSEAHHSALEIYGYAGAKRPERRIAVGYNGYENGGVTFNYSGMSFDALDDIQITLVLDNLADSIYPVYYKVTALSNTACTIKCYHGTMSGGVLTFEECATDDISVRVKVIGEVPL